MRTAFAQRLLEARTRKGLSQPQLAKLAGVAQSTVGEAETTAIGSKHAPKLAAVLGVRAEWLARGEGPMLDASAWPFEGIDIARILRLSREDFIRVESKLEAALEHCEELALRNSPKGGEVETPIQIKNLPSSRPENGNPMDEVRRRVLQRGSGDGAVNEVDSARRPSRKGSNRRA